MRGFRGGREETVVERARRSLETAIFFSREGKARRYLCAMSSAEYRDPDARGSHATVPNRTYHLFTPTLLEENNEPSHGSTYKARRSRTVTSHNTKGD
ncbi:hypothetical protein POX_f07400 [Penicillium oxalicum]|uniref:hypothetical protein n=1 Tax=Penicillium oxalicum TaxID=69781 RepID=UPI0020B64749|nr:hypothetical protein POX_f07400 [Penicillium oxalicum]KAI2787045.1 hypothetical protein POX_f07400 [Penicillium oxalicum]